jgi:serine/threonine-protein kinase
MGVVVQATHVQLEERVAVKFLLDEYAKHPESSARFLREARAAVKIKSEHVARVIDVGTLESGAPYMVMEFLSGRDLSAVLEAQGALPISDAVDYILQACEAIAEAHAAGIVHRDLKPANLFLTRRADDSPVIKVLDFGISKVVVPSDSGPDMSLTKTSAMMGSPLYMSPEQMRSARDVDARSDIWSLGAILYELLCGAVPFGAESLPELCAKILTDPPQPLSERQSSVPIALSAAIMRCLEKKRDARYPTVAELAIALAPFGPKRSRVSVERISKVMSAAGLSTSQLDVEQFATQRPPKAGAGTMAAWGQTSPDGGRDRKVTLAATAAGGLLLLAAAIGVFIWSRNSTTSIESEPKGAQSGAAPAAVAEAPSVQANPTASPQPPVPPDIAPAPAAPAEASSAAIAPTAAPQNRSAQKAPPTIAKAPASKPPATAAAKPAVAPAATAAPPSRATIFGDRK